LSLFVEPWNSGDSRPEKKLRDGAVPVQRKVQGPHQREAEGHQIEKGEEHQMEEAGHHFGAEKDWEEEKKDQHYWAVMKCEEG
jgi:hypothetical protein